jgi:hypothetical protein
MTLAHKKLQDSAPSTFCGAHVCAQALGTDAQRNPARQRSIHSHGQQSTRATAIFAGKSTHATAICAGTLLFVFFLSSIQCDFLCHDLPTQEKPFASTLSLHVCGVHAACLSHVTFFRVYVGYFYIVFTHVKKIVAEIYINASHFTF